MNLSLCVQSLRNPPRTTQAWMQLIPTYMAALSWGSSKCGEGCLATPVKCLFVGFVLLYFFDFVQVWFGF